MSNIEKIGMLFTCLLLTTATLFNYSYLSAFTLTSKIFMFFSGFLALFFAVDFTAKSFTPHSFGVAVGGAATIIALLFCIVFSFISGSFINSGAHPDVGTQLLYFIFILIKNSPLTIIAGCFWGWVCQKVFIKLQQSLTHHSDRKGLHRGT